MSCTNTSVGKILVLASGTPTSSRLVEHLRQIGDVQVESSDESARSLLEKGGFDLVVSPTETLLVIGPSVMHPELGTVLDAIGQGVCIVDRQGQIVWANSRLGEFPIEVRERVLAECAECSGLIENQPAPARLRSLSLVIGEDHFFDATIKSIPYHDTAQFVAIVSDVTRARRLQKKMDAIDNAGRELVRVDAEQLTGMDLQQRLDLLERKVIRCTRELLHFDNFAIRLLDKKTGKLEIVLCTGLPPEAQQIDIYASTENNGISGYVAATGRSYICPDISRDSRYLRGIDDARSSLTVPLRLHDHVVGVLNIESQQIAAFGEDDRQFAEIFGRYIAIALHILEVLVVERTTTSDRLADNVSTEIAGPLNDILADASALMEDYIGHDDLRGRLSGIIDNVAKIKLSVKEVVRPEGGILGARPKEPETDPLLVRKTVLVIDDEEIIRQTVRDVLTKYGCEVETAREGVEAIAMINQRDYDLVITDIRMPGPSGYDIFRTVKDRSSTCPVIFMTGFGYEPNHSIIRARPEGLAAVLYKPFRVKELLADVKAAIAPTAQP